MTKQIKNHPLEDMLDIERGSTPSANPFIVAEGDQHNDSDSRVLIRDEEIEVLEESDEEYINEKTMSGVLERAPNIESIYDSIDSKNAEKFQEIYNMGLQAFSTQMQEAALVEGRFRARNLEVAAQYLRIALDSAKDSSNQKANKDKIVMADKKASREKNNNTTNNNIIVNHSSLLKALAEATAAEGKDPKVVNPESD